MPIYRLFQNSAFPPEQCEVMAAAFEEALQELGLKDRGDALCEVVAKKIIELGQQGISNPQLLRQLALRDLGGAEVPLSPRSSSA